LALPRTKADILSNRHPRKQRVILENHAAVAAGAVDGVAVDRNVPGGWFLESGDDPQQRRLSAAGRADHADELALPNGQIDRRQGFDFVVPHRKALGHAADREGVRICRLTHDVAGSSSEGGC
jgi:hypothetical protein